MVPIAVARNVLLTETITLFLNQATKSVLLMSWE